MAVSKEQARAALRALIVKDLEAASRNKDALKIKLYNNEFHAADVAMAYRDLLDAQVPSLQFKMFGVLTPRANVVHIDRCLKMMKHCTGVWLISCYPIAHLLIIRPRSPHCDARSIHCASKTEPCVSLPEVTTPFSQKTTVSLNLSMTPRNRKEEERHTKAS